MKKIIWLFLFLSNILSSQTIINGVISNESGKPITNVSVVISKKSTDEVIAYSITNSKGIYSISFQSTSSEVDIQVRCMGFETITETIFNTTVTKNYLLKEKTVELKEVIVKNSPISQKGDTIKYSVNAFSKEQDRSIGDVLKRMPGIEVLSDGKILYQGKPINKYYIEGLDLLEGKYNLANDNLPHKEVTQVQILENHQPIKALDSLKFSDNAALNIKLKNAYTFTGQAKIGSGLSPLLWDANITPMLFTKKRQLLSTYQANNTGDNVALQLKKLTFEDVLNQFENNSEKTDWLSIQQLASPNFTEKRWLDNTIHMLSNNYLQKLKKEYELRINIAYLNDYQQQNGFSNTQFITSTNTIDLLEEKYNQLYFNSLQTNFTLQKNSTKNYFKNSLEFHGFWDSQRGKIILDNQSLEQKLSNNFFRISNNLKSIFPFGKQIITLNSIISLNKTPQTLIVNPGQFESLLNNDLPFNEVSQEINLNTFYTHNSASFTTALKQFSFETKIGLQFEKQNLSSEIKTSENNNLDEEFSNDLNWFRSKTYLDIITQFKKNKWRIELETPLNFNSYKISDTALDESDNLEKLTFEPRFSAVYDVNNYWKLNSMASFSNQFGTINKLHYAYILQNYRNIKRVDSSLPQTINQNYSFGVSFRNPIKTVFWNIMYTYSKSKNNLLYQTQVLTNGATELQAIEQNNNSYNHNISSRASKYLDEIKSNITLNSSYGLQDFKQILNSNLVSISNRNLTLGIKIETDITDWFTIEYHTNWMFSKNKIQEQFNPTIKQQNHILNLNFNPKSNQYFGIKSEYINNNLFTQSSNDLFTDLIYRYTIKKKKIDLEINFTNLFNVTNYRTINVNDFSYIETNFNLRPRQVLFKIRFSL